MSETSNDSQSEYQKILLKHKHAPTSVAELIRHFLISSCLIVVVFCLGFRFRV
jgi:hypothetical protein